MLEEICVIDSLVDPNKFWKLTLRQIKLLMLSREKQIYMEWDKTRNIEFALYNTTFAGMSGKKVFDKLKKPRDLYSLPIDVLSIKPQKVDMVQAASDVERMKQHFKWQKE
jgi:hypothetical protein